MESPNRLGGGDPRNQPTAPAKSIRSLSAPTYQVRNNRTCFLRKIFAVNNEDLSYLTRPPMGETNQTVTGQNKSAAKMTQKQVGLWFNERNYKMEKLERAEDDVYQRLIAYERTKQLIEKARDSSPDRSSVALYLPKKAGRATTTSVGETNRPPPHLSLAEPDIEESPEGAATGEGTENQQAAVAENGETSTAENIKTTTMAARPGLLRQDSKLRVQIAENPAPEPSSDTKTGDTEGGKNSARPITQATARSTNQEATDMLERARTELGLIPEHENEALDSTANPQGNPLRPPNEPMRPEMSMEPARSRSMRSRRTNNTQLSRSLNRSTESSPDRNGLFRTSQEAKTQARRIEERILNQPFTYWMKGNNGSLVASDIPYRRREFPIPEERDDEERKRFLLENEVRSKRENMRRFKHLCTDLEKLEKWNPLDEIRAMAELQKQAEKDQKEAEENWKKMGMLRHWVRAFGMREQQELQNLDPNSAEALKRCKYLRINTENTNDSLLSRGKDGDKSTRRRGEKKTGRREKGGEHRVSVNA